MNVDFDSNCIFLYRNKMHKQLITNGIGFFEIYFNFQFCEFDSRKYVEIEYEDYSELVLLPNATEVIIQYMFLTNQQD